MAGLRWAATGDIQQTWPEAQVTETPSSGYRYRIHIRREAVGRAVAEAVTDNRLHQTSRTASRIGVDPRPTATKLSREPWGASLAAVDDAPMACAWIGIANKQQRELYEELAQKVHCATALFRNPIVPPATVCQATLSRHNHLRSPSWRALQRSAHFFEQRGVRHE
jgi:hypothetical protein